MSDNEQADESSKTEEPTPKKLEQARKKGQVPLSREINNWVMLFAATLIIGTISGWVLFNLADIMKEFIARPHQFPPAPGGMSIILGSTFMEVLGIMALPLIFLMLAALLSPLIQVGPLFAPETLKPDISKISPIKGFGRLFSMRSLVEFGKGILKLGIVGVVGVVILYPYFDNFEHLIDQDLITVMDELKSLVLRMMVGVLIVLLVIAVIDLVYQRFEHYKKMRMTKQELKDEYKQSEGDPHVKARLRQLRAERARQRMMQAVPQADVVITNPTHYSIALKYLPEEMDAPQCVAKGIDEVALRIREVAKEHGVIIHEAPPLARALYDTVEIDEIIPSEHYKAVAEVISFVFKQKGKLKKK